MVVQLECAEPSALETLVSKIRLKTIVGNIAAGLGNSKDDEAKARGSCC